MGMVLMNVAGAFRGQEQLACGVNGTGSEIIHYNAKSSVYDFKAQKDPENADSGGSRCSSVRVASVIIQRMILIA